MDLYGIKNKFDKHTCIIPESQVTHFSKKYSGHTSCLLKEYRVYTNI